MGAVLGFLLPLFVAFALLVSVPEHGHGFLGGFAGHRGGGVSTGCSDSQPAPAATWGYNTEVYCIHSVSEIDVNNTQAPGFKMYTQLAWPGLASGNTGWQGMINASASWFSSAAGGFQILPNSSQSGVNVSSCFTNGVAGQWNGVAFTGPMYIKYEIASVTSGRGTDSWWPAGWTWPTEFTAAASPGPSAGFMEGDVYEFIYSDGSELSEYIGWNHDGTSKTAYLNFQQEQPGNNPSQVNVSYSSLIVSPAQNGGTTGFIDAYYNDALNPGSPNYPGHTIPFIATDQAAQILTQHNCILLTTGAGEPMIMKSIQVWQ